LNILDITTFEKDKDSVSKIQLFEGDGLEITAESEEFRFECCKCGVVHRVTIEHRDEDIILRFFEV